MLDTSVARYQRRLQAVKRVMKILAAPELDTEDRRSIAFEAWRTHGGPLVQTGSKVGANAPTRTGANEPDEPVQMNRNEPVQGGSNAPVFDPSKGGLEGGFLQFWSLYPKKTGKQEALRIWRRIKPNQERLDLILRAIREQIPSEQWTKDNGQFIPHPKTWLNQGRWDDEPVQTNGLTHATDVSGLVRFAQKGPHEPVRPKSIRG